MASDTWDYMIIKLSTTGIYTTANDLEERDLNDLSRQGWELDKVLFWLDADAAGWVAMRRRSEASAAPGPVDMQSRRPASE